MVELKDLFYVMIYNVKSIHIVMDNYSIYLDHISNSSIPVVGWTSTVSKTPMTLL